MCWDFYHAAKVGFVALGQATADLHTRPFFLELDKTADGIFSLPGPESLGGWEFWDSAVQSPAQLKLPQLKDAARHLGLQVGSGHCRECGGGRWGAWLGDWTQGGVWAVAHSPTQLPQLKDAARHPGVQVGSRELQVTGTKAERA